MDFNQKSRKTNCVLTTNSSKSAQGYFQPSKDSF